MSHYVDIETEIQNQGALIRALERLGFKNKIEIHSIPQNLYGYQEDLRKQKANIIIRRKYVGINANDIGFEKTSNGRFIAHISEFDHNKYGESWQKKLFAYYGVEAAKIECEKMNYTYTETIDKKERPCLKIMI